MPEAPNHEPMPEVPNHEGLIADFGRLLQLEVELGLAEARRLLVSAVIAVAVGIVGAGALLTSLVVLLAAALAPAFHAPWEHLLVAGGVVLLIAVATLAWSASRLRSLHWPQQTLMSFEETRQWLAAQLRYRLTLQ